MDARRSDDRSRFRQFCTGLCALAVLQFVALPDVNAASAGRVRQFFLLLPVNASDQGTDEEESRDVESGDFAAAHVTLRRNAKGRLRGHHTDRATASLLPTASVRTSAPPDGFPPRARASHNGAGAHLRC